MKFVKGFVTVGLSALVSGCAMYKTISSESIKPVDEFRGEVRNIDYGKFDCDGVISEVKTLDQAQDYSDNYFGRDRDEADAFRFLFIRIGDSKGESFCENHSRGKGVCIDHASAMAALMIDDGYRPLMVGMWGESGRHMMYLYRTHEGFGVLGLGPRREGYETVSELVKSLGEDELYFDKFCVIDLDENFPGREWIYGDVNLQIPYVDGFERVE